MPELYTWSPGDHLLRLEHCLLPSTAASACPWCSTCLTWPSGRAIEVTRCAITRCREIMTPQLSIVKTRFAKASLRARCARHRSWRPPCRLPNGCVGHSASPIEEQGHSATQRLHWSSSFPINVTARPAAIPVVLNTHPQQVTPTWLLVQAAFQLHMLCWSTSNIVAIFVAPIRIAIYANTGGLSRSGVSLVQAAASLGQGGTPSGNNLRVADPAIE